MKQFLVHALQCGALAASTLLINACSGGSSGGVATYTVGGSVAGPCKARAWCCRTIWEMT